MELALRLLLLLMLKKGLTIRRPFSIHFAEIY